MHMREITKFEISIHNRNFYNHDFSRFHISCPSKHSPKNIVNYFFKIQQKSYNFSILLNNQMQQLKGMKKNKRNKTKFENNTT